MKRFFSLILVLLTVVSGISVSATEDNTSIKLVISGRTVKCEELYGQSAVVVDGNSLIPLTAVTDSLSMTTVWDDEHRIVTCSNDGLTVVLDSSNNLIKKGDVDINATDIFQEVNGTVMVSAATIETAFDMVLNYNQEKEIISVKPKAIEKSKEGNSDEKADAVSEKKGNVFLTVVGAISKGFIVTLKLFAITLLGAIPLGLIIALCSMSKFLPLKYFTRFLVWIIRGTPLMLQLLIIFYIPGMALESGSPWPKGEEGRFIAASIAFIINYAFYFSEIYRGGIEGIPKGQVEAGQVLGMTKTQIFFNVTLVQMIKRIVPPMSNEIITLVKDTSIARIISLQEVIWAGYAFLKGSHGYSGLLWPLFFTGVYYLLFNGVLTVLFSKIEKKLSYFN